VSTEPQRYREIRLDVVDAMHCTSCKRSGVSPSTYLRVPESGAYTWLCRDCGRVLLLAAQMALLTKRYVGEPFSDE